MPIMQDKTKLNTKEILLRLADHVRVKKIRGLAEYLGENENKIYAWVRSGNIADASVILAKIPEINIEWLKTGEGPMLRYQPPPGDKIILNFESPKPKTHQPQPLPVNEEAFDLPEMVKMTMEVLSSDTGYKPALASSIRTFHNAVNMEKEMNEVKREIAAMAERMARMEELLLSLGATLPDEKRDAAQ